MRKFLTASIAAATLMTGIAVPAANANPFTDFIKNLSCSSAKNAVNDTGAETKGELDVLLNRKSVDELRGILLLSGTFNLTEDNKSQLISKISDKALECKLVDKGLLPETSALLNNTSSVTKKTLSSQNDEQKKKDKKDFSFADIFNAFSSGISS